MMRVFLGQWAGFCYGVRRAVAMALKGARRYGRVFTLGPLIHNNQAVEELRRNGVEVIEDFESLPEDGVVLLRTHGVERSVREELRRRGIKVLDATCPRVARIHGIIRGAAKRGGIASSSSATLTTQKSWRFAQKPKKLMWLPILTM